MLKNLSKVKKSETVAAAGVSEAASAADGATPIVIQPIVLPPADPLSDGHE